MKPIFRLLPVALIMLASIFATAATPTLEPTDPVEIALLAEKRGQELQRFHLVEDAKAAIKENDYDNAFTMLRQAFALNPLQGEAGVLLSYFYMQKGAAREDCRNPGTHYLSSGWGS